MPYMTIDLHPDNPHPAENAYLQWYETEAEALKIAEARYCIEEGNELHIEPCSEFGDAWLKFHGSPPEDTIKQFLTHYGLRDEDIENVHIMKPGMHPGGNSTWVIPTFDVMIPWIKEREELPPHQRHRRQLPIVRATLVDYSN